MSKIISSAAIDGAIGWVAAAEKILDQAISEKGEGQAVDFPDTAYSLPVIHALTGDKSTTLKDLRSVLVRAKALLPQRPSDDCWLPYLGSTLDAGVAALFACEVLEACKYIIGPNPKNGIWLGAASDVIMRERGVEFVDGSAPGFAAITGAAPNNEIAVKIARELQEKNLYVFMGGTSEVNGTQKQFAEQLVEEGVQLGWETRLVPFGADVSSLIYALGFANRVAMAFGGVKPGDSHANLIYNKERVFAFVLAFGEVSPEKYAVAAGAINYGFPVIADTDIPEILPTGVCTYEHVVANVPHETMVERALEVRGCKIKITKIPVPVSCGAAFEGEIIRKADVHAEFGGNKTSAFEFVTSVDMDQIADHEIEIIGPDIEGLEPPAALPLGIWVEVAGRKMQPDFEPILERQIHHFLNNAEGVWHMGQRDIVWTRVSKDAFARGFRLKHYGEILHAKLLSEYPAIVDKVKVTLITDADEVERRMAHARKVYGERNKRLESMTDESVDTFYSCLLCQSFAPNHVCVISPERCGLCGAYNWLDGKAAYEIDNTGPNQPVAKGDCLDAAKGVWEGVNAYTYASSHKAIDRVCMYSIMDAPMTSCGCFECICAYVPECNGVMVVNREFGGETPVGMKFSTLAGNVGGGMQTPGFTGCGKLYVSSKKFLSAEGGQQRLVWMPKELKEQLRPELEKRFEDLGMPGMLDKIADETVSSDPADIRAFMEREAHPALSMANMEDLDDTQPDAITEPQTHPEPKNSDIAPADTSTYATESDQEQNAATQARQALDIASLKAEILQEIKEDLRADIKAEVARDVVTDIITTLRQKFLGEDVPQETAAHTAKPDAPKTPSPKPEVPTGPPAKERIAAIKTVTIKKEPADIPVHTVTLGRDNESAITVGGATAMPFNLFEGHMPHKPRVAMEVFDVVAEKYPQALRDVYGELLQDPARMAKTCVRDHGADMISIRLQGTHPERGNKTPAQAVELVGRVREAVDVPLIITGQSHFDSSNEVIKEVAKTYAGDNLLLNWVEQDNYRTVAGAALAYGHRLVAQSPIDVNIAKQLNILLGNMDVGLDRVVIDPTTGALGYGLEYTYSVMERIRITGLGGDKTLASPMLVSPGPECANIKECKAPESDNPAWGDLARRAMLWELSTATSLLYAGADILLMYHPKAVAELKKTINTLTDA